MRVPEWIAHHFPKVDTLKEVSSLLRELSLHTVCEEAKCPNIGECFGKRTATFLILGNVCTRNCGFCGVKKGHPAPIDDNEPGNVARAVVRLGLSHVVITSVTRDDLPDGGASQFVATVAAIRNVGARGATSSRRFAPTIELLLPLLDFKLLEQIIAIRPEVINHNVETVPRLYTEVRPKFKYSDSIKFLGLAKSLCRGVLQYAPTITKSGIMVGLGETKNEVVEVMEDLRRQRVDILTIGQYLRASGKHLPVIEYVHPLQFIEYKEIGYKLGFSYVASNPYVRSSYEAQEALIKCRK